MAKKSYKTRPFKGPSDFICPIHKETVTMKNRTRIDEDTGRAKSAGSYLSCPKYGECHYWVSPFNSQGAMVAVIEEQGEGR
jgi:hypothetical protein